MCLIHIKLLRKREREKLNSKKKKINVWNDWTMNFELGPDCSFQIINYNQKAFLYQSPFACTMQQIDLIIMAFFESLLIWVFVFNNCLFSLGNKVRFM